jgi:hypothetical protein
MKMKCDTEGAGLVKKNEQAYRSVTTSNILMPGGLPIGMTEIEVQQLIFAKGNSHDRNH